MSDRVRIAVALDSAGWHPGAVPLARPAALRTWRDLVGLAERSGVDFVTVEDSFLRRGAGHLDALMIASAVAPSTSRIGLVPTVTTAHTEPFHVATGLQTLDHVSRGRGGWKVEVGAAAEEAPLFGRRDPAALNAADLLDESGDVIEVARRLWDTWQDDAVIRDVATGRYLDRDRIHNAHFEGRFFSVEGASIVPRSPQGQLPVTLLAHGQAEYELAARHADLVFVTPRDDDSASRILVDVEAASARVGRSRQPLLVYAELLVLLADSPTAARDALARLDDAAGAPHDSDALVIATTADDLAGRIIAWHGLGYAGFRLRPARLPDDLERIGRDLLPVLDAVGIHAAGIHAAADERNTFRTALGLPVAPNRFAEGAA